MIEINTYCENDSEEVIALILHCQNDGTRPIKTINEQKDIINIKQYYIKNNGNFWVAKENNKVIGTIGFFNCKNKIGILKKFFVYEEYRGAPHYLGQKLYQTLIIFAKDKGINKIILDTPKNTQRAHKFYLKAGFKLIDEKDLPFAYNHPYKDSDFFILELQ